METLCSDHRKAAVGIAENQYRIRIDCNHQLIRSCDDIPHGLSQICTDRIQINLRILKLQIMEKHTVQIVIIILPGMSQNDIEILSCFIDHRSQTNDFRSGSHNDQEL